MLSAKSMFRGLVIAALAVRGAAQVRPASMNIDAYSKSKPALGEFPGDEAAMLKALEDYPTAGSDVRSDGTEIKPGDADWDNYNYYSRLVTQRRNSGTRRSSRSRSPAAATRTARAAPRRARRPRRCGWREVRRRSTGNAYRTWTAR